MVGVTQDSDFVEFVTGVVDEVVGAAGVDAGTGVFETPYMWLVRNCKGLWTSTLVETMQTFSALVAADAGTTYFGFLGLVGHDTLKIVLFGAFQFAACLALLSFLRCVFTKPGRTPYLDPPNVPLAQLNFCEYCSQWKPPRTHHCRVCGICIHRMDHHCHWVNNCVAVKTHKYFILFLLYFVFAAILGSGVMTFVAVQYWFGKHRNLIYFVINTAGAAAAVFFTLVCGALLIEQLTHTVRNQVQLEQWQGLSPYSGTLLDNIECVFGLNRWAWLLPIKPVLRLDYQEPLLRDQAERFAEKSPLCYKVAAATAVVMVLVGCAVALCWCVQKYVIGG